MGLVDGSDEYWELKEHAERLYHKAAETYSSDERRRIAKRAEDLADQMEETYGLRDENVKYLIDTYMLRRLY